MHRSRLAGFIIDCQTDDLESAASFWSSALGLPTQGGPEEDPGYRLLRNAPGDLHVEVQKVQHPSRVHLDIEADDLEAEARRLEALGAKRIGAVKRWIVMEAPTGQRFCIVRPQSKDFQSTANRWEQDAPKE
jgi:predicted enzyme related to lactoylglutathione lyase